LEHQNFLKGLEVNGKDWIKIAEMVKTRSGIEVAIDRRIVILSYDDSGASENSCSEVLFTNSSSKPFNIFTCSN